MCNLTRTSIWLNLVVRLICSIWRRRQSDKLAAKAIWCLSGNQSHVARKLPAPNASDQSQQRGPDQTARLRRAGLGPDWGQIGVCQSGNLAIRRRFCRIAFDWPDVRCLALARISHYLTMRFLNTAKGQRNKNDIHDETTKLYYAKQACTMMVGLFSSRLSHLLR